MKKGLFLLLITPFFIFSASAQKSFWKFIPQDEVRITNGEEQWIVPQKFKTLSLDFKTFKKQLRAAPLEFTGKKPLSIQMPIANGETMRFDIFESPVMEAGLAAKFPDIKSYAGTNPANPLERIRLDISPNGVKAIINTTDGQVYLDPFARFQNEFYIVYYVADFMAGVDKSKFVCGLEELKKSQQLVKDENEFEGVKVPKPIKTRGLTENIPLRNYRIAIATTGLYSKFISPSQSVDAVIAELVTALNRINMVTVNDLSVKLNLIADNDKIVFFDENTDKYTDGDLGQMINANPGVISGAVGSGSYDYGHVFGQKFGGGVVGLAELSSVCKTGSKGRAGSTLDYPKGDPFWIDIVAHEMGHSMGANHSFNNCDGNENESTGYEPGSGSTIMSYSGACGPNDIQTNSDKMYNVGAIEEIISYMHNGNGNTCAVKTDLGNHKPESIINIPNNFTIPISTPFVLKGEGMDEDGDSLTYSWEQYDSGPQSPLGEPMGSAPSFRVIAPQGTPVRVFPRMDRVVGNISHITEVLPTYTRNLNFKMVVRDNNYGGGAVGIDLVTFKASELAGPFLVTYPNVFTNWIMATEETVTWDVAKTDKNPVNCKKVNILMSIDGGYQYPIVLAKNVPNDGSEVIVVPYLPTTLSSVRVRVEAADNIFFDISNVNFTIKAPTTPSLFFNATTEVTKVCTPASVHVDLTLVGLAGFDDAVKINVLGLPSGATSTVALNPVKPSQATDFEINLNNDVLSGVYDITVEVLAPGLDTFYRVITFETVSTKFEGLKLLTPSQGASGVNQLPTFTWTTSTAAELYDIEISKSPNFATLFSSKYGVLLTQFTPPTTLDVSTLYYWRVRPTNQCKDGEWSEVFAFHTITLSCNTFKNLDGQLPIPQSGTPTVSSKITILSNGTISDVNVTNIKGYHDYFGDLEAELESPSGKKIYLWKKQCANFGSSFNFGLDDSAPTNFACPPTNGKLFKPLNSLDSFNGEESAGEWRLIIHDTQVSSGGYVDEWNLTMCSSVNLSPPFIIVNDTLKVTNLKVGKVDIGHLEIGDPNNTPDQLIFTIVETPKYGDLIFNGNVVQVGDQFKQSDINNGSIIYDNDEVLDVNDYFKFTVVDGEGGWLGILQFNIATDESFPNATNEELESSILLFPNPANDRLQIKVLADKLDIDKIDLYNIQGLKVKSWNRNDIYSNLLMVNDLAAGTYVVNIYSGKGLAGKKIIIQH